MVDPLSSIEAARLAQQAEKALRQAMRQEEAQEDFDQWTKEGFDPVRRNRFRRLEELRKEQPKAKATKAEEPELPEKIEESTKLEDTAARFQRKNEELKAKTLRILLGRLIADDDPETILRKVLEIYSDHTLADEALDFVLELTTGKLRANSQKAKELLNERFGREVRAGRNIAEQARTFSKEGLGSPTALRDIYRDITGNPREPVTLFDELFSSFSYTKMKRAIDFLLHSLGADLKSKGPSISKPELQNLVDDARTLQAILGIYRFFESRTNLIFSQFHANQLMVPTNISFELLARQFINLLKERYISPDKVLQAAKNLGLLEEIIAQIIILTQMRDAIRNISPRLYRNDKHREDLLEAILEALEELEEEEEEEEENE